MDRPTKQSVARVGCWLALHSRKRAVSAAPFISCMPFTSRRARRYTVLYHGIRRPLYS